MVTTAPSMESQLRAAFDATQTIPRKMKQMIIPCRLPDRPNLSDDTNAKIAEHNKAVGDFVNRCNASEEILRKAVENATDVDSIGDVMAAAEGARLDEGLLAQDAVRLWTSKLEIAQVVLDELKLIPPTLEEEAEKVVAKVKKQLEEIGCGREAQQAYGHGNEVAVENQFDFLARRGNVHSRAALAKASQAHTEVQGAQNTIGNAKEGLAIANKHLIAIAKKAITA